MNMRCTLQQRLNGYHLLVRTHEYAVHTATAFKRLPLTRENTWICGAHCNSVYAVTTYSWEHMNMRCTLQQRLCCYHLLVRTHEYAVHTATTFMLLPLTRENTWICGAHCNSVLTVTTYSWEHINMRCTLQQSLYSYHLLVRTWKWGAHCKTRL